MEGALPHAKRAGVVAVVAIAALIWASYATWFYWEFGALPGAAGSTPPRIRWCGGGETFAPAARSVNANSVPAEAVWQSVSFPSPYSWRAVPPQAATAYSGIACPMELYLMTDATHFVVYARSGGP